MKLSTAVLLTVLLDRNSLSFGVDVTPVSKKEGLKSKKGTSKKRDSKKASSKKTGSTKYKEIYLVRHGEKIDGDVDRGQLGHEAQCLSEKGWGRAYNLASIFGRNPRPPYKTPDAIFSGNYAEPLDCRDYHGWYRTQQLVSAVANQLDITVDNTTGWMPQLCGQVWNPLSKQGYSDHKTKDQKAHYASIIQKWIEDQPESPNSTCYVRNYGAPKEEMQAGMCCNAAAADKMIDTLELSNVDTILVGWEHANIGFLATALSQNTISFNASSWAHDEFDKILRFRYEVSEEDGLMFVPPYYTDQQNFTWLGSQTFCGAVKETEYTEGGVNWPEMAAAQGRVQPPTNFTYTELPSNFTRK